MAARRTRNGRLSRLERATLAALSDTLVPHGGQPVESASEAGVPSVLERWITSFQPFPKALTRAMIAGIEVMPLAGRHPHLFHRLGAALRDQWVDDSSTSRSSVRRNALTGVETLVQLAYASSDIATSAIGYDGSPLLPIDRVTSTALVADAPLTVNRYPDVQPGDVQADVVVVGSGMGGAVAADTLARAGLSVVVLEEGDAYDPRTGKDRRPVERMLSLYRDNGLTFTMGSPIISLPMGRAVGGTTVVNSGTCFRTPDDVLAAWSGTGIPGVSPDDMVPWFDRVEEVLGVMPVPDEVLGANGETLRRGAQELGMSGGPIRRNIRHCHGHGVCAFGCPIDAKQGVHVTYLPRAVAYGARVIAGARVSRILMDGSRAAGVVADLLDEGSKPVGRLRVRARATVLAAGAVFTPALLLRQHLAGASGQLGLNLVIHPAAGVTGRFEDELNAWRGTMQSYYVDERLADGILVEATFPPPGVGYSAGSIPGWGKEKELFRLYPHMAACGTIVSDEGNGIVKPMGRHGALIKYKLSREDASKAVESVALSAELLLAAGAAEVYPMLPGVSSVTTRREVDSLREAHFSTGSLHLSAYHPMGSARMGVSASTSVVDPWGAVWDVPGLYLMDASILPTSTKVNPQITIAALVARNAAHLADSLA